MDSHSHLNRPSILLASWLLASCGSATLLSPSPPATCLASPHQPQLERALQLSARECLLHQRLWDQHPTCFAHPTFSMRPMYRGTSATLADKSLAERWAAIDGAEVSASCKY